MESAHGSTKPDRKTIEKNRRIHMKDLCSKLDSLLPPSPNAREGMTVPLPDRLHEAIGHIKGLQERMEKMERRKRQLMSIRGRMEGELQGSSSSTGLSSPLPKLEVLNLGSGGLKIVSMSSASDDKVMFYNVVEALEEEGIHILAANYDLVDGDKALIIIHASVTGARRLEAYELLKILMNKGVHAGG